MPEIRYTHLIENNEGISVQTYFEHFKKQVEHLKKWWGPKLFNKASRGVASLLTFGGTAFVSGVAFALYAVENFSSKQIAIEDGLLPLISVAAGTTVAFFSTYFSIEKHYQYEDNIRRLEKISVVLEQITQLNPNLLDRLNKIQPKMSFQEVCLQVMQDLKNLGFLSELQNITHTLQTEYLSVHHDLVLQSWVEEYTPINQNSAEDRQSTQEQPIQSSIPPPPVYIPLVIHETAAAQTANNNDNFLERFRRLLPSFSNQQNLPRNTINRQ